MDLPGGIDDLDQAGHDAWTAAVDTALKVAIKAFVADGQSTEFLAAKPADTPEWRTPDWPGYPARVGSCLGRDQTLALLDWRAAHAGDVGRMRHQEEYLEWRVVREERRIRRIELTTEFAAYWEVLAAQNPRRTLELVSEFAGERVAPSAVYGSDNPFAATSDPAKRRDAFVRTMLPPDRDRSLAALASVSPYNNGVKAMCCMLQPSNTLGALLNLGVNATRPLLVEDQITGRSRFASGSEAIPAMGGAAQDGRNSDPVITERVTRVVTEGRSVRFDDPVGVYIRSVQRLGLAQPDGSDVPEGWFDFSRGLRTDEAPDGRQRCQRLTLEVPRDAGFAVDDLGVRRTGERLRFGGQLAALVQLVLYLRSGPVHVATPPRPVPRPEIPAPTCTSELESLAEMRQP